MEYFRIHAHYSGRTGKPVGVFGACHHLMMAGKLSDEEKQMFLDINAWYLEHLPEPPFYKDGNPDKAVCWFKDTEEVRLLTERLNPLVDLLRKHEIDCRVTRTTEPGTIIYEDDYQVAVT